jgi:hypothetical protein
MTSFFMTLVWVTQGVSSSGKGLGLCGSPMRSKVQISLGANNSLGPARRRSRSITRSVWMGHSTRVQGLPDKGGYMKWPCLGGVHCHKKKKRKKKKKKKKDFVVWLAVMHV